MSEIKEGSFILSYLHSPREVFWGKLISLKPEGVQLRGLNINSFNDWLRDMQALSLSTIFFPMLRVEKIILDEPSKDTPSFFQQAESRVGKSLSKIFGS